MSTTNIEWTDASWNPLAGCSMCSPGCAKCYAETMAKRLKAMAERDVAAGKDPGRKRHYLNVIGSNGKWNGHIALIPEALDEPLRRKKPTTWFVNSMSDLFHPDVPFEFVDKVFAVMALCPHHTFQVLTKRPERMAEYLSTDAHARSQSAAISAGWMTAGPAFCYRAWPWPLPNVWLGTSVEDQKRADERIPHLLRCPAAIRFLSCEPLLEAIDLLHDNGLAGQDYLRGWNPHAGSEGANTSAVDWVIVGGESGPAARPCYENWVQSVVRQCKSAGVAVFVKQLGANVRCEDDEFGDISIDLKSPKGGDPEEWPEDLRVRQMPRVAGGAA